MIELPRAALRAGDLAENAEFFSFGTNDLTQTTFGISRDDSGRFLNAYIDKGIFEKDPFVSPRPGGRRRPDRASPPSAAARRGPDIKLGICGEHGGDPASIAFCESVGLDYVSCSPYRVPIARLAAAQAALQRARGLSVTCRTRRSRSCEAHEHAEHAEHAAHAQRPADLAGHLHHRRAGGGGGDRRQPGDHRERPGAIVAKNDAVLEQNQATDQLELLRGQEPEEEPLRDRRRRRAGRAAGYPKKAKDEAADETTAQADAKKLELEREDQTKLAEPRKPPPSADHRRDPAGNGHCAIHHRHRHQEAVAMDDLRRPRQHRRDCSAAHISHLRPWLRCRSATSCTIPPHQGPDEATRGADPPAAGRAQKTSLSHVYGVPSHEIPAHRNLGARRAGRRRSGARATHEPERRQRYGTLGVDDFSSHSADIGAVTGRLGARFGRYLGVEGELSGGFNGARTNIGGTRSDVTLRDQYAAYAVGFLPVGPKPTSWRGSATAPATCMSRSR